MHYQSVSTTIIFYMTNRKSSSWLEHLKTIVYALTLAMIIRGCVFEIFKIPSGMLQKDSNYSDFDSPHVALCVVNSGDVDVALLFLLGLLSF